jgi:hypothetical protein
MKLDTEELQVEDQVIENEDLDNKDSDELSGSAADDDQFDEDQFDKDQFGDDQPAKDKVTFDENQQQVFDDAIGKKVKATRVAERRADELAKELEELKAKVPVEERPVVPELPDQFADDYQEKMQERDKAVADAAAFDARQTVNSERQEAVQREQHEEQIKTLKGVVETYTDRAKDMGISDVDLKASSDVIGEHGIDNSLAAHILKDDKGPAITVHLAKNPLVLEELRTMSPMQAAIHLENVVKPKLSLKKNTETPKPATTFEGGGSPPSERGPKGATFE